MNEQKVCAIVVTYNRIGLLLECLEALKKQTKPLDAIYLVDNGSNDGTVNKLVEMGYIDEIPPENVDWEKNFITTNPVNQNNLEFCYIRMKENIGATGGFYHGMKRAYQDGYDWLWIMDDDSEAQENALEELFNYFEAKDVSALAGIVKTPEDEVEIGHRGYSDFISFPNYMVRPLGVDEIKNKDSLYIDHASFVGVLVKRDSISKIGFPKKEFFIYADDTEYSLRLRTVGRILLVTKSIIIHKKGASNLLDKHFLGKTFSRVKYENFWFTYFEIRNNTWLFKNYRTAIYFWLMLVRSWLISALAVIAIDDHKWRRTHLITAAFKDGVKGNFDNQKPKRILYSQ